MRLRKAEDLRQGDVLALPFGKTATISEVKQGRQFIRLRTEHGWTRVERDSEHMVEGTCPNT